MLALAMHAAAATARAAVAASHTAKQAERRRRSGGSSPQRVRVCARHHPGAGCARGVDDGVGHLHAGLPEYNEDAASHVKRRPQGAQAQQCCHRHG